MKVYENLLRFNYGCARFDYDSIPDDEMRAGLKSIIDAIVPLRKDKELSISNYLEEREKLSFASHLPKADPFGIEPDIDWRDIDLAMIIVIYEDRHSFGHLYWYLLSQFEKSDLYYRCYSKDYSDPEAPFKQGLIEYAIDFDLEKTVEKFQSLSNSKERYNYALSMLRRSQQEVLVNHPIKVEFESKLSILKEGCRKELSEIDLTLLETDTNKEVDMSAPEEENKTSTGSSRQLTFANKYVRDANNRDKLMSYLHEQLQYKQGQHALVFIQAAINAKLLSAPSHNDFIDEFGPVCGHTSYYKHVKAVGGGDFKRLPQDVEALTKELKEHFK